MRIYTRTGDTGATGLIGGSRVRKNSARIGAIEAPRDIDLAMAP
jgi:cob(I)alamin adenosyltransferase